MRALFLSFLTTLIVLTSAGLGLARGMMPADQSVVICQGHAAVTIWIDAQGNEVEHQHLCPEEGSFFKQGALSAAAVARPEGRLVPLSATVESRALTAPSEPITLPRGPPLPA
ncbi:MAG: hypothetical protein AAFP28_03860 [Pseudomonadota bacterium]